MSLEKQNSRVLLISGGLDSLIAWFYLNKPPMIYFRLGHCYESKELKSLERIRSKVEDFNYDIHDLDIGKFEREENKYIPFRNLSFAIMASNYGNNIYMGGLKDDYVEDKTPTAFEKMTNLLNFIKKDNDPTINITSPFWHMTKIDIVAWYISQGFPIELLKDSVSCYDDKSLGQCGKCPSCFRKWISLKYNKIDCDDWFENNIKKYDKIPEYIKRFEAGYYHEQRCKKSLKVLKDEGLL
jgi:7-cyano-7-deazaguanine synthase in queuosine biosynthesis